METKGGGEILKKRESESKSTKACAEAYGCSKSYGEEDGGWC